jgi:SAM-dependent methyltransferase
LATFDVHRPSEPASPAPQLVARVETLQEVSRRGRERLFPSLTDPSWLILRKRRVIFQRWIAGLQIENLSVLDIGGRIQPYRPLLEGRLHNYVALDMRRSPLVSVVARGEQIPLASAQFDLVICTQVLEYTTEPAHLIAEIHRVLRPGACLMLSVPAIFPRDSDHDNWRFMPHSLRILLRSFRDLEIVPEGGSIAGVFRTACVAMTMLARPARLGQILRFTLVPILNLMAFSLEVVVTSSNDQFTANFSAFARK